MKKGLSKRVTCLVIAATLLSSNMVYAMENVQKDESVYVNMTENGAVEEQVVSDWLHVDGTNVEIKDKSNLSEIKNIKGTEVPSKDGTNLIWKSDKEDIFYEGKTKENLPINTKITYYLNNEEISAKDLAGKSGDIMIKVHMENKDAHMVNINNSLKTIYTPISAITLVTLPLDNFTDVKVNSGEIMSEGNNHIVTAISFPGLKESLDIKDQDLNFFQIPQDIEISAKANKFKLIPIVITATPNLPEIKKLKDATSLDELRNGIKDMKDAVSQMIDGSDALYSGVSQLNSKVIEGKELLKVKGDEIDLIKNPYNVNAERTLINDAYAAENINIEPGMIDLLKVMTSSSNVDLYVKIFSEYKEIGLEEILSDPQLQNIFATWSKMKPEDIQGSIVKTDVMLNKIEGINDDVTLNKGKIMSMASLLNYTEEYVNLLNHINPVLNIKNEDKAKLANILALSKYSSNYTDLGKGVKVAVDTIDYNNNKERIGALLGVTSYLKNYSALKDDVTPLLGSSDNLNKILYAVGSGNGVENTAILMKDANALEKSLANTPDTIMKVYDDREKIVATNAILTSILNPILSLNITDGEMKDLQVVISNRDKLSVIMSSAKELKNIDTSGLLLSAEDVKNLAALSDINLSKNMVNALSAKYNISSEDLSQLNALLNSYATLAGDTVNKNEKIAPTVQTLQGMQKILGDNEAVINSTINTLNNAKFKALAGELIKSSNAITKNMDTLKVVAADLNGLNDDKTKAYINELQTNIGTLNGDVTKYNSTIKNLNNVLLKDNGEINDVNIALINFSLASVNKLQQDIVANQEAMKALNGAMTTENVAYFGKMAVLLNQLQGQVVSNNGAIQALANECNNGDLSYALGMAPVVNNLASDLSNPRNVAALNQLSNSVSKENLVYIKGLLSNVDLILTGVDKNKEGLNTAKSILDKMAKDKNTLATLNKVYYTMGDLEKVKPLVEGLENSISKDPKVSEKIKSIPGMTDSLVKMQKDLKNNTKILDVVNDALKENNIQEANNLLNALPQLSEGVQKLTDGMATLNSGIKQFNTEGVIKLDNKVTPKIDDIDVLLSTKDELVKLSENYGTFTGVGENMDGKVKFIMKTTEIKIPEVKKAETDTVAATKKGFIQWFKNLFK